MKARSERASDRSLTQRLRRSFVAVTVLIAGTLLITGACFTAVLGHFEPAANGLLAGRDAVDESFQGMLDEETGLRGYLSSGDQIFLGPYYTGRAEIIEGNNRSLGLATRSDLVGPIVAMRVAEQRWQSEWVTPAISFERAVTNPGQADSFLLSGKALFDTVRATNRVVNSFVDADVSGEQEAEHDVVVVGLLLVAAMLVVTMAVARRQVIALRAAVVLPVNDLLSTMRKVGAGDLTAQATGVGPPEFREVAAELTRMTATLAQERFLMASVEQDARSQAARLEMIVNVGREISGSLSLRYVAEAVSKAALEISGFGAARMWLIDDERRELNSVHDSHLDHGQSDKRVSLQLGEGLVGRAGQFGRTLSTLAAGSLATEYRMGTSIAALAIPMIVGARIVGVLELMSDETVSVDESSLDVMHSLAGQAATAVEAARFHKSADELSHTDALTHLPNRRRLELDLDLEVARSQRYNRPIACIMLDVDHFKDVNDVHGHQAGDEILSEFFNVFTDSLRETDTAYRYGGEEFCMLLRETDAAAAMIVAERVRGEIANRFAGNLGTTLVTASLGVAALPSDAIDGTSLVAAADRALYAAKTSGRNRVVGAAPLRPVRATAATVRSRTASAQRLA